MHLTFRWSWGIWIPLVIAWCSRGCDIMSPSSNWELVLNGQINESLLVSHRRFMAFKHCGQYPLTALPSLHFGLRTCKDRLSRCRSRPFLLLLWISSFRRSRLPLSEHQWCSRTSSMLILVSQTKTLIWPWTLYCIGEVILFSEHLTVTLWVIQMGKPLKGLWEKEQNYWRPVKTKTSPKIANSWWDTSTWPVKEIAVSNFVNAVLQAKSGKGHHWLLCISF